MRTAFIGMAGPVAYDYKNLLSGFLNQDGRVPNPVLEDVSGLSILYDELVFYSRELCPADMQNLHFVRFLDEELSLQSTACVEALSIGEAIEGGGGELPSPSFDDWTPIFDELSSKAGVRGQSFLRLDNHGAGRLDGAPREGRWGPNAMSLENIIFDYAAASLLPDRSVDVILSTPATVAAQKIFEIEVADEFQFERRRRTLVGEIAALSSLNIFSPTGSYIQRYSDLREDKRVVEFRNLVRELDPEAGDVRRLASEVTSEAIKCCIEYVSKESAKSPLSKPVRAVAGFGVNAALDALSPALGPLIDAIAGLSGARKSAAELAKLKSASFVLELAGTEGQRSLGL